MRGKIHHHIMQCFVCTAKKCNNKFTCEMNEYKQQGSMQNKQNPRLETHVFRIQIEYSALCS